MGFLTSLFGGETNFVTMLVALAIVLVLIVLAAWLVKVVGDASRNVGRGRQRRLMVIDSVPIDNRRQAVIIRRDDTEHLIVIGGPNDLVVEAGFEAPPLQPVQRRPRREAPAEPAPVNQPAPTPVPVPAAPQRPASHSLRHTGLLRANENPEPSLDGGKPDKPALSPADSAKSVTKPEAPAEPVIEARDRDYAQEGTPRN